MRIGRRRVWSRRPVRLGGDCNNDKGITAVAACQVCAKHTVFGRNIRHKASGRWERKAHKTPRTFAPNVHKQRVLLNGVTQRIYICTRCLRTTLKTPV